ncbi:MAG: ABC transporter permease subunit [bacterium]|nr:ABC transporter permease subunit [bacterium]
MRIDPVHALALARLDLGDVLRSRWLVFCLLLYAALAVLFLLVGLRESTVLGFTGMGRVLLSMSHALVLLLPLLALSATAQVINRAQDEGALELLFSHPITRDEYFAGVTLVRFGVLLVPFVGLMALVAAIGWIALDSVPGLGLPGAWPARLLGAHLGVHGLWAGGLDLRAQPGQGGDAPAGHLGRVGGPARFPADRRDAAMAPQPAERVRPGGAQSCRGQPPGALLVAEPTLSVLGPVGFYLTHRVGSASLLLLGVLWPAALGTAGWWLALRRFRRQDLT